MALVIPLPAKEGNRVEAGATRVEITARVVVVAAGALEMVPLRPFLLFHQLLQMDSVTGAWMALLQLRLVMVEHRAVTGAILTAPTVCLVVVAVGVVVALLPAPTPAAQAAPLLAARHLHRCRNLRMKVVSVTGAGMALLLVPPVMEGHRVETGAMRVAPTARMVAVDAGVIAVLMLSLLQAAEVVSVTGVGMALLQAQPVTEGRRAVTGVMRAAPTARTVRVAGASSCWVLSRLMSGPAEVMHHFLLNKKQNRMGRSKEKVGYTDE